MTVRMPWNRTVSPTANRNTPIAVKTSLRTTTRVGIAPSRSSIAGPYPNRLHQVVLVGVGRSGRPRRDGELGEDVADVRRHRLLADVQVLSDHSVRLALREQDQDLELPRGEPVGE